MIGPAAAELVGANPGAAVHLVVLGIVVFVALAVFAVSRRRNKRDADARQGRR